jgi:cytochrome c oxidase subunit III
MTIILVLVATLTAIAGWWLAQQRLTEKPWLHDGPIDTFQETAESAMPAAKVGLGVLLAVISSLFALFASAYSMRMHMSSDWQSLTIPWLLWPNTGVLILSSVAMGWAQVGVRRHRDKAWQAGLLIGGASAILFLGGQILAWRQLHLAGFYMAGNPANAFFYLLTAIHGLHLLGGVASLTKVGTRVLHESSPARVTLSVDLCAIYWHFLLLVWLAVFMLLLHG